LSPLHHATRTSPSFNPSTPLRSEIQPDKTQRVPLATTISNQQQRQKQWRNKSTKQMTSLAPPESTSTGMSHFNKRRKMENHICGGDDGPCDSSSSASIAALQNSWDAAFGLQEEAKQWVQQEQERSNVSYLTPGPSYEHCVSQNGKAPLQQFQKAFVEFGDRYGGRARGGKATSATAGTKTTTVEPSVVLVAGKRGLGTNRGHGSRSISARSWTCDLHERCSSVHHVHAWTGTRKCRRCVL